MELIVELIANPFWKRSPLVVKSGRFYYKLFKKLTKLLVLEPSKRLILYWNCEQLKLNMKVINMTCDQYDADAGLCKLLDFKFYEGMDRPCDYVKDPAVCPVANMKG